MNWSPRSLRLLAIGVILSTTLLAYLPGISGPFVFDDYSNLLGNPYVQVGSLSLDEIKRAIFSLQAGPLQRPVAMLTFALNFYFAGGFGDTTSFKAVNIAIHIVNSLLIFWIAQKLLSRAVALQRSAGHVSALLRPERVLPLSAIAALLWALHPIQLTSVLYVVQRMTSLSALFTLAALSAYLTLRLSPALTRIRQGMLILAIATCALLGALSKENALLLPLFVAAIEITLFRGAWPWPLWSSLSPRTKWLLLILGALATLAVLAVALRIALPAYAIRDFTLSERLMTQARVLFFYIGLILVPRIDQFALLHDDIPISMSLLTPWTTLPSVLGIGGLALSAIWLRHRMPLASLGILWFFAGHLMESSIFPLEIAHEHRNYVSLLGVAILIIAVAARLTSARAVPRALSALAALALLFGAVTFLRANQWSDTLQLYQYEAAHHPRSPGAHAGLGTLLSAMGDYPGAIKALRHAAELAEREPAYHIGMHMIAAKQGHRLPEDDHQETLRRLRGIRISATAALTLDSVNRCILENCSSLQPKLVEWMHAILETNPPSHEASFFNYLLGRALRGQGRLNEAIEALALSHEQDRIYLLPLLELASIYIDARNISGADVIMRKLRELNARSFHPRTKELEQLERELAQARAVK